MKMNALYMKTLLAMSFMLTCFTMNAQNFGLLKDINTSQDASPYNDVYDLYLESNLSTFNVFSTGKTDFVVMNGITYFAADDGVNGVELWRSNGTPAGTSLVKDITPGTGSSGIQSLTVAGNKLYFTANRIVWATDGTTAGTYQVPGIDYTSDITTCLTAAGNTLYFITNVSRLWKTDGTLGGTSLVIDFRQVYNYSIDFLGQLTNVNGTLFFTAGLDNTYGPELWKSNGTAAGTVRVKDIYPGNNGSAPIHLTSANNKLYFSASDGTGEHLWTSDGTEAGTQMVPNANNISLPHDAIAPFTFVNNILIFKGATPISGYELCYYTIGSGSVNLLNDIAAGAASSNPDNITATNTRLYFTAVNAAGNQQLWVTNGIPSGTQPLITAGKEAVFSSLCNNNGTLLFAYKTSAYGNELWKSNGTVASTMLVKDVFGGLSSSGPLYITYAGSGNSLLSANDGANGIELWRTNGTAAGTAMVKNINTTTNSGSLPNIEAAVALNGGFFFSGYDYKTEREPYVSDGTTTGTRLLKDINTTGTSDPALFTAFNNIMFFGARNGANLNIYKSDGTTAGTQPVFTLGSANGFLNGIVAGTSWLYVLFYNNDTGSQQIWKTDGTPSGSVLIEDLVGTYPGYYKSSATLGNRLYFVIADVAHGAELWKSEGTLNSASMVKDINPGIPGSYPNSLYIFNNKLYFAANDGNALYNSYLFTSDGTSGGTYMVKDVAAPGSFEFVQTRGKMFFAGLTAANGIELYKSDGTNAGTVLVKDIVSGTGNTNPFNLTVMDSTVYFGAYDSTFRPGLWKSIGTATSTKLVKYANINNQRKPMAVIAHNLYFTVFDQNYTPQLWISDGKSLGTNQINDAGLANVQITDNVGSDTKLFISGYTYEKGTELYAGVEPDVPAAKKSGNADAATPYAWKAYLKTNPVSNEIIFNVEAGKEQKLHITLLDLSGKIILADEKKLITGIGIFTYPAAGIMPGIYILKLTTEDGNVQVLKLVKTQ